MSLQNSLIKLRKWIKEKSLQVLALPPTRGEISQEAAHSKIKDRNGSNGEHPRAPSNVNTRAKPLGLYKPAGPKD